MTGLDKTSKKLQVISKYETNQKHEDMKNITITQKNENNRKHVEKLKNWKNH